MKLKQFLQARKKAEKPAKFSFSNIFAVFQSWGRKQQKRCIAGFSLDDYIYEQIIWRRTQVIANSPMCWYSGNCKICGCDILGKTMEDRGCSILEHPEILVKRPACYPNMMNKEEWNKYKQLKNIKLFE